MAIRSGEVDRGVLVCGSGVGASIAASKIPGIRAAICHDTYSAHQGVEHDDMNVLCLGSEIVGGELVRELVRTFLAGPLHRWGPLRRPPRKGGRAGKDGRWLIRRRCRSSNERRGQRLDRLPLARDAALRRARRLMSRRRDRRRHLEPDDLPEGARRRRPLRRPAARARGDDGRSRSRSSSRSRMDDIREACDLMLPVWERTAGVDGWVSLEVDPTLAYEREQTFEQAVRFNKEVGRPEPLRQDPGHRAGPRCDRGLHREGRLDQRDADLLARALRRRGGGLPPRARAARRRRRRSRQRCSSVASFFVSRVDTEADRRLEAVGRGDLQGQARRREREARLPALPRRLRRRPLGLPRRQGRPAAALPLGVDLVQEPRLPRRDLRRGADRARHGEHDAARDGEGLPGAR